MLALVSCEDNSQTNGDIEFEYDFGDYGFGYELCETEDETEFEPEYDYLIDIFEDVEEWLTFSGAGNECKVELKIPEDYSREINGLYIKRNWFTNVVELIYNNKSMGTFSYYIDNEYNLTAGDVVKIYSNDVTELNNNLLQNGFYIKDAEYQFSYPDRGSYIKTWEEAVDIYNILAAKAKKYYCEEKNIDINSQDAENVYTCMLTAGVYGEIKPDEVLNSESRRVRVGVPIEVYENGHYNYYLADMWGIVIESAEIPEGEFYSDENVRVEMYIIWPCPLNKNGYSDPLNTNGYSELCEAVQATMNGKHDEYDWYR